MDKETREFIEKMFCNLNIKIDKLYYEVKEIKELQLNHIKESNFSQGLADCMVNTCCDNSKKEEVLVFRKKTTIPNFKTKIDKMNEDLLRILKF
ncbi:hypothetical protein [Clostridium tagluense]|uniref:hypothetical protein n=1 Tax=Clostridium tagluense TaxID=360422 RepID=UPI001CF3351C|nr:hypothetical protein [Clostridium tagluense]MCB2299868.1 hypothetical protein [Clostridium tagluense]